MANVRRAAAYYFVAACPLLAIPVALMTWGDLDCEGRAVASPCLTFSSSRLDLGALPPNAVAQATWRVENKGARRLILIERGAGCCGDVSLGRRFEVAPRSRQSITLSVQAPAVPGAFEQTVDFTTNDSTCPRVSLSLRGTVETGVSLGAPTLVHARD